MTGWPGETRYRTRVGAAPMEAIPLTFTPRTSMRIRQTSSPPGSRRPARSLVER
ncbi:MAG: hypothetical protein QOE93_445 [Actinomycetota bacterium]|nr:hypothetical protein [Actinomycetota bacterium]